MSRSARLKTLCSNVKKISCAPRSMPASCWIVAVFLSSNFLLIPGAGAQSLPEMQVNALEGLAGKQPTFRRSGAKGICAVGHFEGNKNAASLTTATAFNGSKHPAIIRFSVGGGNPKASDKSKTVRGLAVAISLPNGQQWQMANISAPIFFVAKPEQFVPFLEARTADPVTGKPDPEKLKAFNEANPETTLQGKYLANTPVPASYASTQYWSTNAFELVNSKKQSRFVRWQFVPDSGIVGLTDEQLKNMPDDFLANELRQRVAAMPVVFNLQFQVAETGDVIDNPTIAWPQTRTLVDVGRLVINKVEAPAGGACDKITFNPLILPEGVKPSSDPVLNARASAYVISLGRRLSESVK